VVERRLREKVDHAVRAGADDNRFEWDPVPLGECRTQRPDAAVGIAVEIARRALDRLERRRKRRERAFVRCELDDPVEPELALHFFGRLAGLVRNEVGDRLPEQPSAHSLSLVPPRL
jgi:hypothetical protein